MILIFGGEHQGKLDYALDRFGITPDHVYLCNETDTDMPKGKRVIYKIDRWILALLRADKDVAENIAPFTQSNCNAIIICNDISCGIVPIDPTMRAWREAVGKSIGLLAQHSDEIIRLFCGIPTRLK